MSKWALFIVIFHFFGAVHLMAQSITYGKLSYKYSFKIQAERMNDTGEVFPTTKLKLYIYQHKKLMQTISIKAGLLFKETFTSDSSSRSYITGKNLKTEVYDYDFGDFIIADLNFDGREDLAVKFDSGGNGGPLYNFYLQQANGRFKEDRYLTEHVISFPEYINSKHKTISTQIHANVHQEARKTFQYNTHLKKWRLIAWVMVND